MSANREKDPLDGDQYPDRVYYAEGVLLGAVDFGDEQNYHRGRLARALACLCGSGTVSGLRVEYKGPKGPDEEIIVHAGLAIDRLGRLIELPRDACIRLDGWYRSQTATDLAEGFHAAAGGVIADVFIRFMACERGKTPAFAAGPFDATDYVTPSRLRDGYHLDLVIRKEAKPGLPQSSLPDLAGESDPAKRRAALHQMIFDSWNAPGRNRDQNGLVPLAEHAANQNTAAVFLARLIIPAAAGNPPLRTAAAITPDNDSRAFAYSLSGLARWLGI
ncbi:MAG: hypothetical protein ABSG46_09285 [Candidatus Binataceae bacterium]|jgi:hypothetical protein